jgi:hypothetical protein
MGGNLKGNGCGNLTVGNSCFLGCVSTYYGSFKSPGD